MKQDSEINNEINHKELNFAKSTSTIFKHSRSVNRRGMTFNLKSKKNSLNFTLKAESL